MISYLEGIIIEKTQDYAVFLTKGGVGYKIFWSSNTASSYPNDFGELSRTQEIFIYTKISESDIQLFGFVTPKEKDIFEKIIKVHGVGPRVALNILSYFTVSEFIDIIKSNDSKRLSQAKGLGAKTAQKICSELKGRFGETNENKKRPKTFDDVKSALVNMGIKSQDAMVICNEITKDESAYNMSLEELLKVALSKMRKV